MTTVIMEPTNPVSQASDIAKPHKRKPIRVVKPSVPMALTVPEICDELRNLHRFREAFLKDRICLDNKLNARVRIQMGYSVNLPEEERKKAVKDAEAVIKAVRNGENVSDRIQPEVAAFILASSGAVKPFDMATNEYGKAMERFAKMLPVADWVRQPEQLGFGFLMLARIIGEAGDLNNYEAPGKLWRRMGCAPYESQGKMKMPSTWRSSKPSLSSEEWTDCGYSPRRRSIIYQTTQPLIRGNGENGPYKQRYNEAKALKIAEGWKKLHAHNHAMLLMGKRLLRELWCEWTGSRRVTT